MIELDRAATIRALRQRNVCKVVRAFDGRVLAITDGSANLPVAQAVHRGDRLPPDLERAAVAHKLCGLDLRSPI